MSDHTADRPFSELRDDLYERSPESKARVAAIVEHLGPLVTKTGKVLTDADVQALADEAEQRGYDVTHLLPRKD